MLVPSTSLGLLLWAGDATAAPSRISDTVTVALVGLVGAVIGSLATVAVQILQFYLAERAKERADQPRKRLLLEMLDDSKFEWRRLDTLMHIIGADEETTKRLLLAVGARASEDGQDLWALLKRKPLRDPR